MQLRNPMFKNLVEFKLKMDVLYQRNAYHQYLATVPPSVDATKDAPDVVNVCRYKIQLALCLQSNLPKCIKPITYKNLRTVRTLIKAMYFCKLKVIFFLNPWFSFSFAFSLEYRVCCLLEVQFRKDLVKYLASNIPNETVLYLAEYIFI